VGFEKAKFETIQKSAKKFLKINSDTKDDIISDIEKYNFKKILDEIVKSILEGKFELKDIHSIILVLSQLHRIYEGITEKILSSLSKIMENCYVELQNPSKTEDEEEKKLNKIILKLNQKDDKIKQNEYRNKYTYLTYEDIKNIVNNDNNKNLIAIQSKNELNIDYISPTHAEYILNKSKNEINNLINDDEIFKDLSMKHQLFIEEKNSNQELGVYFIFTENKNDNFDIGNDNGIIDYNRSNNLKNALLNDKNQFFDNVSQLNMPFGLNSSKVSISSISSKILKNNIMI
jgi:hypothetical protein